MTLFRPSDERELAGYVREAAARGEPMAISGGATKHGIGAPVEAARRVSLAGLSGVVAYEPAEMVATFRAGTGLADVEALLAGRGQRLAFEPPDYRALLDTDGEPTIGGAAAANLSGPRRISAGAARDALLGLRFVNGRGEILRAGGRVMKNVTGLDLVKLLAGSWGTLGILGEVTFKVLPKPETETTLVFRNLDDERACAVLAAAMASPMEVTGAAHLPERIGLVLSTSDLGAEPATLVRLEGFAASVADRAGRLQTLLAGAGEATRLDEARSHALWRDIRDVRPFADGTMKPVWRIAVRPSDGPAAALALRRLAPASTFFDWQGGLVWARMEGDSEADAVRAALAPLHGHATLWRASEAERRRHAPFPPLNASVAALSARVRAALDPAGIFNPGRMGPGNMGQSGDPK